MTENELFKKVIKGDTEGRSRKKNTRVEKGEKKPRRKDGEIKNNEIQMYIWLTWKNIFDYRIQTVAQHNFMFQVLLRLVILIVMVDNVLCNLKNNS